MQSTKRLLCLLLASVLVLSLFSGCGQTAPTDPSTPSSPSEPTAPDFSEMQSVILTVAEYEQWLNAKLTELGYPLQVTFLEPDEDGYAKSELTYTGTEEDIYTEYLYFYVFLDESLESIALACVSARENCSQAVLDAHKKMSAKLSYLFDPNITQSTVDAIFELLPQEETAWYVDPTSGVSVETGEPYHYSSFDTAICKHALQEEIETGHIWYLVYTKTLCTDPALTEVQDLVNEAFQALNEPLQAVFSKQNHGGYFSGYLYSPGDPQANGQLRITARLTPEGDKISSLDIIIPNTAPEKYTDLQKELAIRLCSHYYSTVSQSDVELLFDINANWDQYQEQDNPNLTVYPEDRYLSYRPTEDTYFSLVSYPGTNSQGFFLHNVAGSATPDDEPDDRPVLEYPVTADAFIEILPEVFPEWIVTPISNGPQTETDIFLADLQGNHFVINTKLRAHDQVIKSIYICPTQDNTSDPAELMQAVVPKINALFEPDMDEEACRARYEGCDWQAATASFEFSCDNYYVRQSQSSSGNSAFTFTFKLAGLQLLEENYFVKAGMMQAPSTVDGRFSFLASDLQTVYDFHTTKIENCLEAYLSDIGYPLFIDCYSSSTTPEDIENHTENRVEYKYAVYDSYTGQTLSMTFLAENQVVHTSEKSELYHIVYNRDLTSLYSENSLILFTASGMDPIYITEPITRLLMGMSMLCDDGMTETEAKALFSDTYEPIETSSGYLYVIYAPRDVVHILREDPQTGQIIYSVCTKADYEMIPVVTLNGEPVYTELE